MQPAEEWKPVVGYEGAYEVSDRGAVRSIPRRAKTGVGTRLVPGGLRKLRADSDGRISVNLSAGNQRRTRKVHHLVLEAFGPTREVGTEACHGDGNPSNNCIDNLRWDTHRENTQDTIRHGRNANLNKARCRRDHQLVEPNLKGAQLAKGERSCLSCAREYALARAQGREFDPALADERYEALGFTV
ncbi:NUMOD4 motif-containing HNH endonuclease [Clavibacter sp. VKM Ac-2872]|uniref:NUMOD4 motif-containing HNH endonuclease n=1 Tax=Clavibacter sp. VKM Ac-2872 TaxID=2783812 RepID=UPI00188A0278|nr:NUMOD4 motif-containing HNH endonuclease [Clavibacter sp. VKM Ac-2872]MBF4625538.1 HNH endonuclease [Clavibacter sp. VKM Ac-2872]